MELRGRKGHGFAIVRRVDEVYPIELKVMTPRLAACMDNGGRTKMAYQELVGRLEGVGMTATAKGEKGTKATLITFASVTSSPPFKTAVELAQSGTSETATAVVTVKPPRS